MKFVRATGSNKGQNAELHVYDGGACKIVVSLSSSDAQKLAEKAVSNGGTYTIDIVDDGESISASIVGARVNTYDRIGNKLNGPGDITFESLAKK